MNCGVKADFLGISRIEFPEKTDIGLEEFEELVAECEGGSPREWDGGL